jgi:uncharacterized protein YigA (DUF484 family)
VRLLQTLANSMSVALENARLFDETQRLFKESEQRAAELAIINSVQQALAAELNIQGIYDAVGHKIREIFNQADLSIRVFDLAARRVHFPYLYERGERVMLAPDAMQDTGFEAHILKTGETIVINEGMQDAMARMGSQHVPGTQVDRSAIFVPLVVGAEVRGLISLSDMEKEHAFSDSDVRLLQTLAGSMSVALENARLFDETQRLFKESEQRAAELAIINSVQRALAAELNMQGIYDAVGDKIRELFRNADLSIRIIDPRTGWCSTRTRSRKAGASRSIPRRFAVHRARRQDAGIDPHQRGHEGPQSGNTTRSRSPGRAPPNPTCSCRSSRATRCAASSRCRMSRRSTRSAKRMCVCCRRSPTR